MASDTSRREILEALAAQGLLVVVSADALDQRVDFEAGPAVLGDVLRQLLRHDSYIYVEQPGIDEVWVFARSDSQQRYAWRTNDTEVLRRVSFELTDPDPEVRLSAVLAAAEFSPASAVPLLLPAIQDPTPAVRDAAEAVLEDLGATEYVLAVRLTD